ncbi:MAG: hypothetical protein US71_C0018G0003 [Parcubacteria group bacterium GW2011_GWD2_38_12]|nr:MAG: hypothetical protein US06_C0018G0007 [Parcubacteria group bacterium GW2011_GWC2_36_17]KKQ40552.1 MAG: hypothetical protein US56_C0002G0014 [Candidatus Moranbacteria bacterium GW2011_GWF2_37_7]KKQ43329.1 MAG: hypothetical protein US61_C0012G0003 [Parcubacteria group bacterium GW2011_GWE2_37_8]KKQ51048.1 MAG: hypothetical protein US71_C0018G0003 [Parcubacteria group bacterium GW2011_GWD2_38_12]KKQ58156.1 MAG: hypothetical protein US79_C0012G0010 [Parcubacteria group bacterium GW2011_GWC1_
MNFLKYRTPFLFSLIAVYFLGYLYRYDFGFGLKINELLTESVHYIVFIVFGFLTCHAMCLGGKIKRPHTIYAFAIIFFISVIGVFNEVRIHPEHGGNVRDMFFHLSAGILGMIIWRLALLTRKNIV